MLTHIYAAAKHKRSAQISENYQVIININSTINMVEGTVSAI